MAEVIPTPPRYDGGFWVCYDCGKHFHTSIFNRSLVQLAKDIFTAPQCPKCKSNNTGKDSLVSLFRSWLE